MTKIFIGICRELAGVINVQRVCLCTGYDRIRRGMNHRRRVRWWIIPEAAVFENFLYHRFLFFVDQRYDFHNSPACGTKEGIDLEGVCCILHSIPFLLHFALICTSCVKESGDVTKYLNNNSLNLRIVLIWFLSLHSYILSDTGKG